MFVCSECGASQPMAGACSGCGGSTLAGSEDPLLGASVGPYRIARLLGVGGMGRVYKGVQPQIGSRVAVKVLSRECTDRKDLVERFFSEARAVNLIRHESIVNVLDLAMLPDGRPYIVMEYLDGAPLSDLVTRIAPMPLGGVARLCVEVLDALGAAHAKGIVHRDLKPDNIFITPAGRAKVLDFGIAKLLPELGGSFTQTGSLLGTPHYMSPEQASGKAIDARTDLYAMGVILFECATGQKPFVGDSMFDLLRKHVDQPPPSPRSLRPEIPPALDHLILTALAKDPAHRFPHAAAMTSALQQATSGMAPEQWAVISGSSAGVAPTTPSGAGWGTPASWGGRPHSSGGASAVSAPAPMPQPPGPHSLGAGQQGYPHQSAMAHAPTAPYGQGQQAQGPHGPGGGAYQPYPGAPGPHAGPPGSRHPSTATSGQVVGGKRGSSKLLWAVLGLVAAGGIAVAVVVGSPSSSSTSTTAAGSADPAIASGSAGSGSSDSPWAAGSATEPAASAGSAAQAGSAGSPTAPPATDVEQVNDDQDADPAGGASPAGGGDEADASFAELRELQALLADLPEDQRAMVRAQLEMVEAQLKQLPAAQRAMVLSQLRSGLQLSAKQMAAAKRASEAAQQRAGAKDFAEAPPAGGDPPQVEREDDPPQTTPLYSPLPPSWNGKRFDVSAYLPTAVAAVRKIAPDAKLFRIDAEGVLPDGIVDLSQGSARYGFISKARAARPSHIPLGGKWEPKCQINVWVEADGIDVREFVGCKETPVPMPRCSFKQRWQQMIAKGAPRSNAIAEMGYRAGVIDGKAIWFFDIGDAFDDGPSPDACP
jgi:serine/threonine protein kinase